MNGPTGISLVDGALHVDGYSTAKRLGKLNSKAAQHLACLRLHDGDLKFCENVLPTMAAMPEGSDTQHALFIAIIVQFTACFRHSSARDSLKAPKVYKGHAGAVEAYRYYDTIRDKHIVHDENALHQVTTFAVLGENDEIIDILTFGTTGYLSPADHVRVLGSLIAVAREYVRTEVERCLPVVFDEVRAMSLPDRAALPSGSWRVPLTEELSVRRSY